MPSSTINTVQLQGLVDRMRTGDITAREELVRGYMERLEQLASKMLRGFPGVRRWEQTGDVLNPAWMRLLRALEEVRPDSTGAFMALAALQIRRELLNLVDHHFGPLGLGNNHESVHSGPPEQASNNQADLEKWAAFHQEVEKLPSEERDAVNLVFYHGLSKADAAQVLGIHERTVRRHWRSAMVRLDAVLNP